MGGRSSPYPPIPSAPSDIGVTACGPVTFFSILFSRHKGKNNLIFYVDLNMSQASNASWNFERTSNTKLMTGL